MTKKWSEELREFDAEIDERAQAEADAEDSDDDADMDADSDDDIGGLAAQPAAAARAEARADRWFSGGVFAGLDVGDMQPRERKPVGLDSDESDGSDDGEVEREMAEEDLPYIPMTDKQKR